jgi:hypothetical protein
MATNARRNRAFVKERNAQIRQHILILRDTAKEITALLAEARRRIEMQLALLPSDYQKWYLPQVRAEINAALREFNQMAGNVISLGADDSWNKGISLIDAPLAASGIQIAQALPQIDRAQLLAMKQFMTTRIADISTEVANRINGELAQVIIGVQSPGDAVGKVAGMVDGGRGRAITIVRTELGRAFSIAGQQRLTQASEYLPGLQKQWRRSGKIHSRITHDAIDGQIRDQDKPFNVGTELMMFPRDPKASAKNTINCGCLMIPFMKHWQVKHPERLQFTDEELRLSSQKQSLQAQLTMS